MKEKILTGHLVKHLKETFRGCVVIKHADRITSGVPDISVTCSNMTVWIETKHVTKGLSTQGLQDLMMTRLAQNGHAFYVIYDELNGMTFIVTPEKLHDYRAHHETSGLGPRNHQIVSRFLFEAPYLFRSRS